MSARGLVALGDSITNGRGEPMLGVHPQSWAQWLAEALGMPFTKLAQDGACAPDVLREQLPMLAGPYDIGCLHVGVNDARGLDWDAASYERDVAAILDALAAAADRLVVCTIPADLGRPPAAPKPEQASAILRRLAVERGAVVVALDDFTGMTLLLPDAVHPTALGQVAIAERAVDALAAAGIAVPRRPSDLVDDVAGRWGRTRWTARYGVLLAQDLVRRGVERISPP